MSVIMIVERDKSWLDYLCLAMHRAGYDTITTHNTADALALASIHQPDAVLVELDIRGHVSKEVCQQLRTDACTQTIPVFLYTHLPLADSSSPPDFIIEQSTVIPELIHQIEHQLNLQHANTA